ncbi:hypothetical protein BU23DRAFT_318383 [Bimuria novae-zelandiae CBS 107.79]|uniref:Uncharacterized protein n=1 Tax=Bimuria novae-zelandiae CBS 107.79 TaxID=1447943 RepID=A0A6A5VK24_9PLEO|nr:hypothetical protein BU23DRAFT_318383 [Bimuria novae-zelandiae CBS 107.79]
MPPTDGDLNASGRNSRASEMSSASRGPSRGSATTTKHDMLAPAVASMLMTSTEMGNLGTFATDLIMSNIPRAPRRGGTNSRLSIASSSHSNTSSRTAARHQHWSSTASQGTRHSREMNMPQYVADTLSPTVVSIPGSSGPIPFARDHRDAHRSLSMTMANCSEPAFPLSSNRSLASLCSQDPVNRPRSPWKYPSRLRRHGHRPSSPVLSDTAGSYPRRRHGYSDQGFPPYQAQMRNRRPSDISMRRPPSRSQTPVYYGDPHPDIPPVPALQPHRHAALERERERKIQKANRSASHTLGNHSTSSGSINRRFESDVPSSDSPSPPTPRDGDMLVSPTGTLSVPRSMSGTVNYYDYSEQYEGQDAVEPSADTVPTGFVRHIKTIIEERGTPEPVLKGNSVSVLGQANHHADEMVPNIPELLASPVPRRITRDLVLAGLGPESSSGEMETSVATAEALSQEQSTTDSQLEQTAIRTGVERRALQPTPPADVKNRHSILSQAGSSAMDSSTLEFAVRCSISMVADKGVTLNVDDDTMSVYVPDVDQTREDGMTDLLDGYQRTDTKDQNGEDIQIQVDDEEPAERRSNHAAKLSDEQSFKSSIDVVHVADASAKETDVKSFKLCDGPPEPELPFKDSDAKSFKTCQDTVIPDRIASLPGSRLSLSLLHTSEPPMRRPYSELPVLSPVASEPKAPLSSTTDSSMSRVVGRFRANSKPSSTQGSAGGSFSSFKEHGAHTPPAVPPRESSSSKEAQQSRGVANFLLRSVRQRFAKASPGSNLKPDKENTSLRPEELEGLRADASIPTPPPMRDRTLTENVLVPTEVSVEVLKAPQRVVTKESVLLRRQSETMIMRRASVAPKEETPKTVSSVATMSNGPQVSYNTPSPMLPEASSVYSPDNNSSTRSHGWNAPMAYPQTPERHRRDSQVTTHLSWGGPNASYPLFIDKPRDARSSQENSTTDLRLPGLRHAVNHLPDLKEESHEDSSLNTSASNFRPLGGSQPAVFQVSADDIAMSRRYPSAQSSRNSVLQQMHLPSMNFSSFGSFDEALDHRVSHSLDLAPAAREELARAVVPRSASAGDDRDKYKSVFAGLDTPAKTSVVRQNAGGEVWMRKSPDLLMKEVDSLTIPSVNGLTTRLSEMLPKLKEALGLEETDEFPDEEGIMEKAMEKLNELGAPAQKRSSARLRPVPGSPNMLVVDDQVFKEIIETKEEAAPTAWSFDRGRTGVDSKTVVQGVREARREAAALDEGSVVSPGATRDRTKVNTADLKAPSPAQHRHLNSTTHNFSFPHSQSSPSSVRSLGSTPTASVTGTRPWNLDKNYPWATDPSVDISLPPPSASNHSPRPGPSHLRNRLSNASSQSAGTSSPYTTSASPLARRGPTGHCYNLDVDGRRSLEPSALGFDASGYPIGPLRVRDDDQSHGAGERYPTSALPLPSNLHIYPGQSSNFSLETSDDEQEVTSARKNLFKRRARRSTRTSVHRHDPTQGCIRELKHSQATDCCLQEDSHNLPDRTCRQALTNAKGMSWVAFRTTQCRLSIQKGWNKFFDKIFLCYKHPGSPAESDSTYATVPAHPNSRASSDSNETQLGGRDSLEPVPAVRSGPGRRFTSGFLFTFPSLSAIHHDAAEPTSAFQSKIPPRSAAGPSSSN